MFANVLRIKAGTATYSYLNLDETKERLRTSLSYGLSPAEAEARLLQNGRNELPNEQREPLWLRFLKQFKETLILLLLASAVISFVVGNLDDAVSITIAVTIVVTVGFVQEYRSEKVFGGARQTRPTLCSQRKECAQHQSKNGSGSGRRDSGRN